jgi:hypothetical protein
MLDLGHVALETSIDDIPDMSKSTADFLPHYLEMLETAGLKDVYPSTTEGKPDVPLYMAFLQTLACGVSPNDVTHGDRDICFGNAGLRETLFMDRLMKLPNSDGGDSSLRLTRSWVLLLQRRDRTIRSAFSWAVQWHLF